MARPPPGRSFDNPGEAAWQGVRRVPHPARCFSKPVWLRKPLEDYSFTRTYIKALDEPRPAPGAPPRTSTIMSRSGLSSPRTRCSSVVPKPSALPVAGKYGLGALTWSPLNSGWLTGRFRRGEPVELTAFRKAVAWKFDLSLPGNQRKLDAVE